jgi:hypothetical protein
MTKPPEEDTGGFAEEEQEVRASDATLAGGVTRRSGELREVSENRQRAAHQAATRRETSADIVPHKWSGRDRNGRAGGRYWIRTSDPADVNRVL